MTALDRAFIKAYAPRRSRSKPDVSPTGQAVPPAHLPPANHVERPRPPVAAPPAAESLLRFDFPAAAAPPLAAETSQFNASRQTVKHNATETREVRLASRAKPQLFSDDLPMPDAPHLNNPLKFPGELEIEADAQLDTIADAARQAPPSLRAGQPTVAALSAWRPRLDEGTRPDQDAGRAQETRLAQDTVESSPLLKPAALAAKQPLSAFGYVQPAVEEFRPLLEVDRFDWPLACDSLRVHAGDAFAELATQLLEQAAHGQKVLAFSGGWRGEGRTTALMCLARELGAKGCGCVIVDADFTRAGLGPRLGVAAEAGWEDVLAGDVPLAEVLISSVEDGIALVPLRGANDSLRSGNSLRAAVAFGVLRDYYDLVLVDTGPIAEDQGLEDLLALTEAAKLDGAFIVYDGRSTSMSQLGDLSQALSNAGIAVCGAIENFAAATVRFSPAIETP